MGKVVKKSLLKKSVVAVGLMSLVPLYSFADKTDDIVNRGLNRQKAGAESQKRIDQIADATDVLVGRYNQQAKLVESLKVYNDRVRRTITAQEVAMSKLQKSIEDASLIERQIVPLMMKMIEGLDTFVKADMPFQPDERTARIERIRSYLTNANISAAERFRQVLNAYQIESDYGKNIYVYTDELTLPEGSLNVNVLQVGRAGLYYQTLDGAVSGYWDKANKQWVELDSSHNQGISDAIRIATDKQSPDLMKLPLHAPEVRS